MWQSVKTGRIEHTCCSAEGHFVNFYAPHLLVHHSSGADHHDKYHRRRS
jgi:hypothetical protein